MEDNKNLVLDTENTEHTAEKTPAVKTYTQEEVDAIVGKKIARTKAKIEKQKDREYGELMETLRAGTGKQDVREINDTFSKFYESKGIKVRRDYSAKDIETLARAEADEIINGGYEEVVEEVDRLTNIGADKMNAREKALFKVLAEHRASTERNNELAEAGITEDVYNSKDFKEFAGQFNSNVPISKVYDIYKQTQPKKEFKTMGSMKNTDSADSGVKDFYSPEEARRFTRKELDENPALFAAIKNSMQKWKK